jgi:hypothetical protein
VRLPDRRGHDGLRRAKVVRLLEVGRVVGCAPPVLPLVRVLTIVMVLVVRVLLGADHAQLVIPRVRAVFAVVAVAVGDAGVRAEGVSLRAPHRGLRTRDGLRRRRP